MVSRPMDTYNKQYTPAEGARCGLVRDVARYVSRRVKLGKQAARKSHRDGKNERCDMYGVRHTERVSKNTVVIIKKLTQLI